MSDFNIEKRKRLLIEFGHNTAQKLNELINEKPHFEGRNIVVHFNDSSTDVNNIVGKYFDRVASFKAENKFDNTALINCSKISAIWGLNLLAHGYGKLFRVQPQYAADFENSLIGSMAIPLLVYRSAINIMRIDPEKVSPEIEKDLFRCLSRYPDWTISVEWLSWSLELLRQHSQCPIPDEATVCLIPA